jgi:hypothetical protein
MGRLVDAARRFATTSGGSLGGVTAGRSLPAVHAGAGTVALARRPSMAVATPAFGFGPPLAPFTFEGDPLGYYDRAAAMSLPTISRARDLIVSAVSALPFTYWSVDWTADPPVERRLPPPSWFTRPDPNRTRQWLLAWTVDDLYFYERAHWLITSRHAAPGYWPSTFRRIAPGGLEPSNDGRTVTVDDEYGRKTYPAGDVIEFLSPIEGLLSNGARAISIALQLDASANRFAACEVPNGVLEEQEGSEDLTDDELYAMAERFAAARQLNSTAAVNKYVRYREIPVDADAMQLVQGREYQSLELSRLGNVPPYLAGAPAGTGMTYLNGQQSRQDLIDFGAAPFIGCIEQTLSGPNVTPRGNAVRLDLNAWLRNPFTTSSSGERSPNDMQIAGDDTVGDGTDAPVEVPL